MAADPRPTLPVIFRKDRGKRPEVTAVFPTEPADYYGHAMTCYAHVGQHSGCKFQWYWSTRPATPEEYADLLAELRRIYEQDEDEPVTLVVARKITGRMRETFAANLHRQNHPEAADA